MREKEQDPSRPALIFDLSEVILTGLIGLDRKIEIKHGLKEGTVELNNSSLWELFRGEISEGDYIESLPLNKWGLKPEEFKTMLRQNFTSPYGTEEMIEEFKQKGYQLVLVTDHAKEWIEYLKQEYSEIFDLFDNIYVSAEYSVCKSDINVGSEGILSRVVNDLGSNRHLIFFDDSSKNVMRATEHGIAGMQFKGEWGGDILRELISESEKSLY